MGKQGSVTLYRDHRGGLADSMDTVRKVSSRQELIDYLRRDLSAWKFEFPDEAVKIEPYGYDARINWDTYIVTVEGFGPVGFTNGPL